MSVIHSKSCSAQFVLIANIQCSLKLFCLFCCRLGFGTCVTISKRDCYIKLNSSLWSKLWVWERKITFIRQCCNIDMYWFCVHIKQKTPISSYLPFVTKETSRLSRGIQRWKTEEEGKAKRDFVFLENCETCFFLLLSMKQLESSKPLARNPLIGNIKKHESLCVWGCGKSQ